MARLTTWIDLNAPYYPTYYSAYPDNVAGRCPLGDGPLERLGRLTGVNWNTQTFFGSSTGPWLSFDRPELSPCLAKLDKHGPQYKEALSLIERGKDAIARRPRGDTLDFVPCATDQCREATYAQRRQIELRNREAIRKGQNAYDP